VPLDDVVAHARCASAGVRVRRHERVRGAVPGIGDGPADRVEDGGEVPGAGAERRVVGREDEEPARAGEGPGDDQLRVGQVVERVDAVLAEVVGGDVRHAGGRRARHGEPAAEHPAARGLEHRGGHAPVAEHQPGAAGARPVARLERRVVAAAGDAHAVGAARADHVAGGAQHRGRQPDGGGLAVGAGHQRERHVVHRRPVDGVRIGERVERPAPAAGARADGHLLVVPAGDVAARVGGGEQGRKAWTAFGGGAGGERVDRGGVDASAGAHRLPRALRPRRPPRRAGRRARRRSG
jgi:hypothetical protein